LVINLKIKEYKIYQSDLRVYNSLSESYVYPDIVVVKGKPQLTDEIEDTILNPIILVEVISPLSEKYDKLTIYQNILSCEDYLIVSQNKVYIEHHTKENNLWKKIFYSSIEDRILLQNHHISIKVMDIYDGIEF
jgi:Uma2 family endonuclease